MTMQPSESTNSKLPADQAADKLNTTKKPDFSISGDTADSTAEKKTWNQNSSATINLIQAAIDELDTSDLSEEETKTLQLLKELHFEHACIEEAYRKEWSEIKLRYLEKFRPLYLRRWSALTGNEKPAEAKISSATNELADNASRGDSKNIATGTSRLPKFWLKAMQNHPALDEMIEDHDEPILEYLEDIRFRWVDPNEQTSFQLDFVFSTNPYFTDRILSKAYYLEPSEDNDEESVLTRTVGTTISWNEGKNVTETTLVRKQRNKRTNATRLVSDVVRVNSFFNFFKTYEVPNENQLDELTEDDISALEMIMETEFELGAVLRDKIIPRALGWYLGTEHDDFASENLDEFEDQEGSEESVEDHE